MKLSEFRPLRRRAYKYQRRKYDYRQAENTIRFIESVCFIPEGARVGQLIELEWWQKKIIRDVYRVDKATGARPVRQAIMSMGRKNGKTAFLACLIIAHLSGPLAVRNAELNSFALTRDQASILFRYAAKMVRMTHRLADRIKVVDSKKSLEDKRSGSFFVALSADARSQLGKSPVVAFGDELGAFRQNRDLYDAMLTAGGAHENPLMWIISTQAPSDQDLLSELIDYAKDNPEDEALHLTLYDIPEEKDPYRPKNWALANPALGSFLNLQDFAEQAKKASQMPGAANSFLNLRCNRRVDALTHFLSREAWVDKFYSEPPGFEDIQGMDVFVGIDLAMRRDLSAVIWVAEFEDGVIGVVPSFFMPADALLERQTADKVNYKKWVEAGHLITPPGNTIDFAWVAQWMAEQVRKYDLRVAGGGFDRYKFGHLQQALIEVNAEDEFAAVEEFGQGYVSMSPAVDLLESMVYEDRLWHGDHPVLTWNIANCVVTSDPANNRKLDKSKAYGKIDGAVALAMALKSWDLQPEEGLLGLDEIILA